MPLHYVGIRVSNLRRSLRFYTKVMGLRVKVRGDNRPYGAGLWVGLTDPRTGAQLELNWYPPGSKYAVPYEPGEGLDHVGFILGKVSRKALEAEYDRVLRGGAKPTRVTPASTHGWAAFVKDPDGNWIELFRWPTAAETRAAKRRAARPRTKRRSAQAPAA